MFERQIEKDAVIAVVYHGDIIKEYPDDEPYPSFLLLGFVNGKPLHVVLGLDPVSAIARIITVYHPDPDSWAKDFKTRRLP